MAQKRGGQMGTADMKTDMQRMQEMQDMFRQWSQRMMSHATETKDPYAWCTYMNMMTNFEGHQKAMQQVMQVMGEEQTAGMEMQASQMHMKIAPAMMGEKMRM